jgi:hypothetical protein
MKVIKVIKTAGESVDRKGVKCTRKRRHFHQDRHLRYWWADRVSFLWELKVYG